MFRFSLQLMWDLTIHSPSGFSIPNRCEISQFIPLRGVRSHNPLPSGPVSPTNVGSHNPPSFKVQCSRWHTAWCPSPFGAQRPHWHTGPASSLAYCPVSTPFGAQHPHYYIARCPPPSELSVLTDTPSGT